MILVDRDKIEIKSDKQILNEAIASVKLDGDTVDCTKCKANIRQQLIEEIEKSLIWNYYCPNILIVSMKDCLNCEYQLSCESGKVFVWWQALKKGNQEERG